LPGLALAALGTVLGQIACKDPTQATLLVRTNVPYRAGITVGVYTSTSGKFATEPQSTVQEPWLSDGVLGDLVITPNAAKDGPLSVRVVMGIARDPSSCTDADPQGCIVARRKLAFVPRVRLRVPVVMHLACQGVVCGEDSTCNALGQCAPAAVDANACATEEGCVLPGDEKVTQVDPDAGLVVDAGVADAQNDAGPEDAARPDDAAGPEDAVADTAPPPFCTGQVLLNTPYAGGTGTPAEPFLICTPSQFQAIGIRPQDWASHFQLRGPISLTGLQMSPIGDLATAFRGRFDGGNFAISNASYLQPRDNYGLFGVVEGPGEIANVLLQGGNFFGLANVGVIAGRNSGTISNCAVRSATVGGTRTVGGAVGTNTGNLSLVTVDAQVTASTFEAGGVAGYSNGAMVQCGAKGIVRSNIPSGCSSAGGLVGAAGPASTIDQSFSAASATGTGAAVGGLVGTNEGLIEDSYARGVVAGGPAGPASCAAQPNQTHTGGLVGFMFAPAGVVRRVYASGTATGQGSHVGGLVGYGFGGCTISSAFATGLVTASGGVVGGLGGEHNICLVDSAFWDLTGSKNGIAFGLGSPVGAVGIDTAGPNAGYFFGSGNQPMQQWNFATIWIVQVGQLPRLRWQLAKSF